MSYLSEEKIKEIKKELEQLKTIERRKVAKKLQDARSEGDLSENADYEAAKEAQSALEARIFELEKLFKEATPITKGNSSGVAQIGSIVFLKKENGDEISYMLVSKNEAKPEEKKLSYESPLGKEILGKKTGEKFEFTNPKGDRVIYKITAIN